MSYFPYDDYAVQRGQIFCVHCNTDLYWTLEEGCVLACPRWINPGDRTCFACQIEPIRSFFHDTNGPGI